MITISRRRNWNQLENCQKYAHKLSSHACTWHELVDVMFFGQWTNLLDQSQNGRELVTDAWLIWFHTFITQVTAGNLVIKETRLSIVDWVYPQTQILLVTLKIHNQTQENLVHLWKSSICSHKLDVQEINVSIRQFCRIRNYFVGCFFENGRATCSRLMRRGDRSVTFIEEYRSTNPWRSMKRLAKSQI